MNYNQNDKIAQITSHTLIVGVAYSKTIKEQMGKTLC